MDNNTGFQNTDMSLILLQNVMLSWGWKKE